MIHPSKVDLLNFALIWVTLLIAYQFPFELFLFSYAVLGPLHYMTEINWLEKKNYFLKDLSEKRNYLLVITIILSILTMAFLIGELAKWEFTKSWSAGIFKTPAAPTLQFLKSWGYSSLFVALFLAMIFNITENRKSRILLFCLSVAITILFFRQPFFATWFGVFLPTIIHVFLFTFLFMWSGTIKSKSGWGVANLLSMVIVLLIIAKVPVTPVVNSLSQETLNAIISSNFLNVNYKIGTLFGEFKNNNLEIYSSFAWKTQIFIAFAYTYHYLNWFSKTSIINWHQIDRNKMRMAILIWVASVGLYYFNYALGFAAFFVFSMLHVILEFPLNISSIRNLFPSQRKTITQPVVKKSPL